MTRDEFVAVACANGIQPLGSETTRRDHAEHLVKTAEHVADRLGLTDAAETPAARDRELVKLRAELRAAGDALEGKDRRIRELEEALDEATMPAPKKKAAG